MMHINEVINIDSLPSIDIHGEISDTARLIVNDYINDNYKMKNNLFCVVHGVGRGILKKTTHEVLKHNNKVKDYKTFYFNQGITLVEITVEK